MESECFHCIGKVQLSLGDFVAARRSLKKALLLGSQQPQDRMAVKKGFKYADRGCKLEEDLGEDQGKRLGPRQAVELAEQLGDLCCKVGCYSKALDAYQAQLKGAEEMGKPARELAVIHVSLAATYTDLRQHGKAVEHYRKELALRQGNSVEECKTWLNIAASQEDSGCPLEAVDSSYSSALRCAEGAGLARLQRRCGAASADDTEARLQELCASEGWNPDGSDGEEEEEEEMDNSEPLDDSDVILSDSGAEFVCVVQTLSPCCWSGGQTSTTPAVPLCEGVTPLHDALTCGNFGVARLLVERGASVTLQNSKGETALDTLRQWQRTYGRELDGDTRQECAATEKLLRKALAGGEGAVLPAKTVRYPNGGGVSAYLGGTEPEEQRRLFCTGLTAAAQMKATVPSALCDLSAPDILTRQPPVRTTRSRPQCRAQREKATQLRPCSAERNTTTPSAA
ncbi:Tonsoku-like protein [Oryzias melastigma]|uniref:Tonsoku-like protein n=1 Tax=Oryzias melastigma TaxID=30732 RepID=A0A834C2Z8_ORYME|nr:Tonsoku-like protein [Oryzias melastigma]